MKPLVLFVLGAIVAGVIDSALGLSYTSHPALLISTVTHMAWGLWAYSLMKLLWRKRQFKGSEADPQAKLRMCMYINHSVSVIETDGIRRNFVSATFEFDEAQLEDPEAFVDGIRAWITETRKGGHSSGSEWQSYELIRERESRRKELTEPD